MKYNGLDTNSFFATDATTCTNTSTSAAVTMADLLKLMESLPKFPKRYPEPTFLRGVTVPDDEPFGTIGIRFRMYRDYGVSLMKPGIIVHPSAYLSDVRLRYRYRMPDIMFLRFGRDYEGEVSAYSDGVTDAIMLHLWRMGHDLTGLNTKVAITPMTSHRR